MNPEIQPSNSFQKFELLLERLTRFPISLVVMFVVVFGLYFPTIWYDYSNFRDDVLIESQMSELRNWKNADDILLGNVPAQQELSQAYRPMMSITFMADATIGGGSLVSFRITNLIIQALIGFFLFRLFMQLEYNRVLSLLISIATVVNPFMLHSFLWLPARGDLLLVLFGLLSIISFIRFSDSRLPVFFGLNMFFYALALLTNESAVFLPIIFIVYLLIYRRRQLFVVEDITLYMIWAAITGTWLYFKALAEEALKADHQTINTIWHNLEGIPFIIGKMAFPAGYSTFQSFDGVAYTIGVALIVLLIIRVATKKSKAWNRLIFTFCFALITSIAFLDSGNGFFSYGYDIINSRAYLFAIGFIIFSVELLPSKMKQAGRKFPIALALASIVYFSIFSGSTYGAYKNADSFFANALKNNPNCAAAHFHFAKYLSRTGDTDRANNEYTIAISQKKDYFNAFIARSEILAASGNMQAALDDLDAAYSIDNTKPEPLTRMADINAKMGKFDEAIKDLNILLEIFPQSTEALNKRGCVNTYMHRYANALEDFGQSLKFDSNRNDVYLNRAIVYIHLKDFVMACKDLEKSSQMGNKAADVLLDLYCKHIMK